MLFVFQGGSLADVFDKLGVGRGKTRTRGSSALRSLSRPLTRQLHSLKPPAAEVAACSRLKPHSFVSGQETLLPVPVREVPGGDCQLRLLLGSETVWLSPFSQAPAEASYPDLGGGVLPTVCPGAGQTGQFSQERAWCRHGYWGETTL